MDTATYNPQDDKIRLFPASRLSAEDYQRVKAAGFGWAPKQGCFYAVWTPEREDMVLTFVDEIDPDDMTREERAAARDERFRGYAEARRRDAEAAAAAVSAIADNIPFGQPILVGHHSERHARRDAERIESGMRRAVENWKTADYWRQRAGACAAHADYLERPDVRARRIKGLEADARKQETHLKNAAVMRKLWSAVLDGGPMFKPDATLRDRALAVANHASPRYGLWGEIRDGKLTPEDAVASVWPVIDANEARATRWLQHINNRIEYERAMLGELPADNITFERGGRVRVGSSWYVILRVNKSGGRVVSLSVADRYLRSIGAEKVEEYEPPTEERAQAVAKVTTQPPLCNYPSPDAVEMSAAEWKQHTARKWSDSPTTQTYNATETAGKHRRRVKYSGVYRWAPVFITDQKRTDPPAPPPPEGGGVPAATVLRPEVEARRVEAPASPPRPEKSPERVAAEARLKAGVQAVAAPDLFPTPAWLAARMVAEASIEPGNSVLEPSAGTGSILMEIVKHYSPAKITAVEINRDLCARLAGDAETCEAVNADFLECNGELGTFDRIVMNPPFSGGADIRHIQHARAMLKPGGRLVALCAAGPRQEAALRPLASHWEVLEGAPFAPSTSVRVVLLTIVNH